MRRLDEVKENDTKRDRARKKKRPAVLTDEGGREYSARTLIVLLEPDTDEVVARSAAERHGVEILYLYRRFPSMAVKTSRCLTAEEMDALAAELEKEEIVLGTARDYITRRDDPVKPPEVTR